MIFISTISKLYEQLKNNTINNESLLLCLQSQNYRIVAMSLSRLIERNLSNNDVIDRLSELGKLLTDNKFIGPWQLGHFAIATLSLLEDKDSRDKFDKIYKELNDNDKFLVNNFIKCEAYKL